MQEERQEQNSELAAAATTCDDTAFWVYTQGSAGFPKATMHSHRSPLYASQSYAKEVLNLDENDIIISTSALHSSQGLMERIFFPLLSHASIVMLENKLSGSELLEKMRTHKTTVIFSSPDIYSQILQDAENQHESVSLPSLRACISTNQPLTLATQISFRYYQCFKQHRRIVRLYNQSSRPHQSWFIGSGSSWLFYSFRRQK